MDGYLTSIILVKEFLNQSISGLENQASHQIFCFSNEVQWFKSPPNANNRTVMRNITSVPKEHFHKFLA